jgi:hypothetical protein
MFRSRGLVTSSATFSSSYLPGFFHPGTLLGFALQSLLLRKSRTPLGALTLLLFSRALFHGRVRQHVPFPGRVMLFEAASGSCSPPELVHIYKGFSFVEGRCSPGLHLFRGFPLLVVPLSFESGSSLAVRAAPPPLPAREEPRGPSRTGNGFLTAAPLQSVNRPGG